jgi:hypothetical protein
MAGHAKYRTPVNTVMSMPKVRMTRGAIRPSGGMMKEQPQTAIPIMTPIDVTTAWSIVAPLFATYADPAGITLPVAGRHGRPPRTWRRRRSVSPSRWRRANWTKVQLRYSPP